MLQKAKYFNDHLASQRIMETNDPKVIKNIGKNIDKFDDEAWKKVSTEVIFYFFNLS